MTVVALGVTLFALMGIPAVFLGAYVSDRFGRRRALMASTLASAAVYRLYPSISDAPIYLLLSALAGVSLSIYWPASNTMLTDLTPPEERGRVFGWLNVVNDAALGAGALLGSVTVDSLASAFDDPARRYQLLPLWSVRYPWRRTRSLALAAAFFAPGSRPASRGRWPPWRSTRWASSRTGLRISPCSGPWPPSTCAGPT